MIGLILSTFALLFIGLTLYRIIKDRNKPEDTEYDSISNSISEHHDIAPETKPTIVVENKEVTPVSADVKPKKKKNKKKNASKKTNQNK